MSNKPSSRRPHSLWIFNIVKLLWHDRGEGIVGVHPFIIMVIVVVVVIVRSVGVVVAVVVVLMVAFVGITM